MEYLQSKSRFTVTVDDADCVGRLKPSALMKHLQDLATTHAEALGVGFHALYEKGLFWVLTRMSARFARYPTVGQTVRLTTVPHAAGIVECVRDFYVCDENGQELGRVASSWCLIGTVNRRIAKQNGYFSQCQDEFSPDFAVPDAPRKVDVPDTLEKVYESAVRYSELDRNRHVNNSYYGDMVLNSLDINVLDRADLTAFDFVFTKELTFAQSYSVYRAQDGDYTYTQVRDGAMVLFCARLKLKPREEGIL